MSISEKEQATASLFATVTTNIEAIWTALILKGIVTPEEAQQFLKSARERLEAAVSERGSGDEDAESTDNG